MVTSLITACILTPGQRLPCSASGGFRVSLCVAPSTSPLLAALLQVTKMVTGCQSTFRDMHSQTQPRCCRSTQMQRRSSSTGENTVFADPECQSCGAGLRQLLLQSH